MVTPSTLLLVLGVCSHLTKSETETEAALKAWHPMNGAEISVILESTPVSNALPIALSAWARRLLILHLRSVSLPLPLADSDSQCFDTDCFGLNNYHPSKLLCCPFSSFLP